MYFILIFFSFNFNSHFRFVANVLGSAALDREKNSREGPEVRECLYF